MLKESFLYFSIRKQHFSMTMLNPSDPVSLIDTPICPFHLSISISLIIFVFTFVTITTGPLEDSKSMFLIIQIVSFILITLRPFATSPFPFSMFHSLLEFTNINLAISPTVLTLPIWLPFFVLSCVNIPITKYVCSLTML